MSKPTLKLRFDEEGWFSFPIYTVDLVDVLEDRANQEKTDFKFHFIDWVVCNMDGKYNNKPCKCSVYAKKTVKKDHKKEGKRYQFFATFTYFSKARAQWKDIKLGLKVSEFKEFFKLYRDEPKNHVGV